MDNKYNADSIKVLEGLEGVRKRPSMYIGSTGEDGLHHLVYEIVDNSVDEALAGACKVIKVSINKDGSVSVSDDGRGIPVDEHPIYKIPAIEVALTKLHAGGKFDKKSYMISGGLHGVGVSVVNALSKKMIAQVKREGNIYQQEYSRGYAKSKLIIVGKCSLEETGTTITFWPDEEIFSSVKFDYKVLENRFREISFLNPGLKIILFDETKNKKEEFLSLGGLIEFVELMNKSKEPIHKPVYFRREIDNTIIEVAIQYNEGYQENIFGFVNTINTVEGGTHVFGFKTALTRVINDYAKKKGIIKDESFSGDDVREGLTAIISLKIPNPQFEGQTKTKLGNSEIKGVVDSIVTSSLSQFFEENPSVAKKIVSKAEGAAKARIAAKKAKELVRRKNAFSLGGLPGKLADCSNKKSYDTELYLVEGESAGGCFAGDTKVALADGRNISFKELVEEDKQGKQNFCYTIIKDGNIGVEKIESPRITKRNVQVIKVVLNNNQEIICTPDHKFMLRNGEYKQAKDLLISDSLMPLYKKVSKPGDKIKRTESLNQRIDVYDIEVPNTHNFALASGIFVHNSAKMARDKEHQAILPLRGKILNVEKSSPIKSLSSEEITNMISVIGTGIGEQFDIDRLRYNKIIIMSDADVDGEHIKTLLLTFFFRFMPKLIENGNIYVALPPLFRIRKNKDYYVYDEEELAKMVKELNTNNITRFKGLGEMSANQLWDTTMDPKKRKIKRIFIEDAIEADRTFSMLMGDDVHARRMFISENAKEANLDI